MQLEKASSGTLIAWIFAGLIALALAAAAIISLGAGAGVFGFILGVSALVRIITAWMLDDSKGPVVLVDERGLVISPVFSSGTVIPWSDIGRVEVYTVRYGLMQLPIVSYLIINLTDTSHIGGLQWFFPPAWFGRIAIPTALLKEGGSGAARIVRAAQGGLLDGEIMRERKAAGTDAMLARGDVAIQRALAARGGLAPFPAQPQTTTELSYGAAASAHPTPPRPIPRDYGETPETVPLSSPPPPSYAHEPTTVPLRVRDDADRPMTIKQPGPIMVNGLPYHPERVGGFGRKRR